MLLLRNHVRAPRARTTDTRRGVSRPLALLGIVWASVLAGCAPLLEGDTGSRVRACGEATACTAVETAVAVMNPLLAERIARIASRSPSFRTDWDMIRRSGVPIAIGTEDQLNGALPRWYRSNPSRWVGVTVVNAGGLRGGLEDAVVALRVGALRRIAHQRAGDANARFLAELDRVLIHEIYGHLAPIIAAGDPLEECPDHARRGEAKPCVQVREERVAGEIARSRAMAGVGVRGR